MSGQPDPAVAQTNNSNIFLIKTKTGVVMERFSFEGVHIHVGSTA